MLMTNDIESAFNYINNKLTSNERIEKDADCKIKKVLKQVDAIEYVEVDEKYVKLNGEIIYVR